MSAPTATLLGALIGGGFALVGVVVDRLLMSWGQLWCEPSSDLEVLKLLAPDADGIPSLVDDPGDATEFEYSLHLDLFNSKDIPVGLRDISLKFIYANGPVPTGPLDGETHRYSQSRGHVYDKLHVINLPPKQWVHKELRGWVAPERGQDLMGWERVEFVAEHPRHPSLVILGSKTYRKVVGKGPLDRPRWRRRFGS